MPVGWAEWQLSSDMKYMLVKANYMKVPSFHACRCSQLNIRSNGDGPASATTIYTISIPMKPTH